jgi:hypothetical protein
MNEYYPDHILKIPNATPETRDAAQYMFHRGRKQFNLCGEFCVAYCMQDEAHTDDIDEFLAYWEAKEPKWYNSLFKDKLARTTGVYDLKKMLGAYDVTNTLPLADVIFKNPYVVREQLVSYQAIVGVQIDYTGYLVSKSIPHWVVLESVLVIDDLHAICSVYNPFTNAMEPYSWKELMTSTGAYKYGLWIER